MAEPVVVRLAGVEKDVGEGLRTRVLHGIDLEVRRGEFAAVMGPSGSGKSTLLNLVGLLDRPTAGRVEIAGQETSELDDDARARHRARTVGFVFQFHHLLPGFTALENVMLPMAAETGRFDDPMRARALRLLAGMGLADRAHLRAPQLSGGQQQRVAIARALAMEPEVVLADEPTGNLDSRTADEVFAALRAINREVGVTFLVVTHDPRIAARCDRTIELVDGRILRDALHRAPAPERDLPAEARPARGGEELLAGSRGAAPGPAGGPRRAAAVGLAGAVACCWGVLGHVLLLGGTACQLAPRALEGLGASAGAWLGAGLLAALFGYGMGHRGLHRSFAPRVVARAIHLAGDPDLLHALLAPAYTAGLLHAPPRRRIGTAVLLGSMAGFALLVGKLPEPHRGAVDLAVAVALAWGAVAVVGCALRALGGRAPQVPLHLPEP